MGLVRRLRTAQALASGELWIKHLTKQEADEIAALYSSCLEIMSPKERETRIGVFNIHRGHREIADTSLKHTAA